MTVLYILLGFVSCGLASLGLGLTALRLLRIELTRGEALCLGYVLGSALNSTLTLLLAFSWMARKGVFLAVAAGALLFVWRSAGWLRGLKRTNFETIPLALRVIFAVTLVLYGVLYFRQALSPEMSADGTGYHLALVNLWNHAHGLERNTRMYAALPEGMEMLFLFAFAIGRHSAAALVHFSFLMLLPLLMVLYGCRFGWMRGGAVLAAILIFVSPLFGVDGTAAYNDVAMAAIAFGALYLLEIWRGERRTATLAACCVLAGFAFAVKYTGGFLMLFVAAMVAWESRRARLVLASCAIMALPAAPYLIRNAIWFQNPIAFFGNSIFPNPWFHVSFEKNYTEGLEHLHGIKWGELPRELTFGGPKIDEAFGPAFLLMPVALAGLLWPRTRMLLVAATFLAGGFLGNKDARFLIPSAPLAAMAAGFALSNLRRSDVLAGAIILADVVISWPAVNHRARISSGWTLNDDVTWAAALRIVPQDQWLMRDQGFRVLQMIDRCVPEDTPVLALSGPVAQSYTARRILVPWESAFGERMNDLLLASWNSPRDWMPRWTITFPPTRVRELDILQTGHGAELQEWSVNEIRLYSGGTTLRRSAGWKLDASPNPWDAGLAFDGLLSTRWRSWDTYRPGMWIRARFDPPQQMDRAEVIASEGPVDKLVAAILDDSGRWSQPTGFLLDRAPPVDCRRQATEELKRQGIEYLLIKRSDWMNAAFRGDYAGWGVQLVGSTENVLLLKVD